MLVVEQVKKKRKYRLKTLESGICKVSRYGFNISFCRLSSTKKNILALAKLTKRCQNHIIHGKLFLLN